MCHSPGRGVSLPRRGCLVSFPSLKDKRQKTKDGRPDLPPLCGDGPEKSTPPTNRRPKTGVDDIIEQRYSITSLFTRSFFALFARVFARFFNVFACALGRVKCARFRTIRIFLTPLPSKDTPTRRFLGVHFSHFSQGPARVREQSASLNAHRPDSNPTLYAFTFRGFRRVLRPSASKALPSTRTKCVRLSFSLPRRGCLV